MDPSAPPTPTAIHVMPAMVPDRTGIINREAIMNRNRFRWMTTLVAALSVLACLAAAGAPPAGKKAHAFKGKVEKVDEKNKTLTVNGETVEGWMGAMTMNYKADKDDVYKRLKAGDTITAKVYDGDFTTLYDIQVAPPQK